MTAPRKKTTTGSGRLVGYARVSTTEQNPELQIDALDAAGVDPADIFSDTASGKLDSRPALDQLLAFVRSGDTVVVWRLDRLGRSLAHLISTVEALEGKGVGFRSLTEGIDTTTSGGKLIFHIFGALAQFERELIIERTKAGLAAARSRGRVGGRPSVMTTAKVKTARNMIASGEHTIDEVATTLGVSRATIYRHLAVTGS